MRLREFAALAGAVAVPLVLAYVVGRLARWAAGKRDPVDALIARNAAQPVPGMEAQDRTKTDRAGERRWQQTLRAQRRTRQKPQQAPANKNIVPLGTRRTA